MQISRTKVICFWLVLLFVATCIDGRKHRVRDRKHKRNHKPGHVDPPKAPAPTRTRREVLTNPQNNGLQDKDQKVNNFIAEIPLPPLQEDEAEDYQHDGNYKEVEGIEYEMDKDGGTSAEDLDSESTFWNHWPSYRSFYPVGGYRQYLRRRGWWPAGYANRWG